MPFTSEVNLSSDLRSSIEGQVVRMPSFTNVHDLQNWASQNNKIYHPTNNTIFDGRGSVHIKVHRDICVGIDYTIRETFRKELVIHACLYAQRKGTSVDWGPLPGEGIFPVQVRCIQLPTPIWCKQLEEPKWFLLEEAQREMTKFLTSLKTKIGE